MKRNKNLKKLLNVIILIILISTVFIIIKKIYTVGILNYEKKLNKRFIKVNRKDGKLINLSNNNECMMPNWVLTDFNNPKSALFVMNKFKSQNKLKEYNIPVPKMFYYDKNNLDRDLETFNYPLVVKPIIGSHGNEVKLNLLCKDELVEHLNELDKKMEKDNEKKSIGYIIEEQTNGDEFRINIMNNKIVGIMKKVKLFIIGNGKDKIKDLIKEKKKEKKLKKNKKMQIDNELIKKQGYDLDNILEKNKKILLNNLGNMQYGMDPEIIDIKTVHKDNYEIFKRVGKTLNLYTCGIDYIGKDLNIPYYKCKGKIIEVNQNSLWPIGYRTKYVDDDSVLIDNIISNIPFKKV